MQTRINNTTAF